MVSQTPASGQFSSVSAAVAALPDDGSAQTIFIEAGMSFHASFTHCKPRAMNRNIHGTSIHNACRSLDCVYITWW